MTMQEVRQQEAWAGTETSHLNCKEKKKENQKQSKEKNPETFFFQRGSVSKKFNGFPNYTNI